MIKFRALTTPFRITDVYVNCDEIVFAELTEAEYNSSDGITANIPTWWVSFKNGSHLEIIKEKNCKIEEAYGEKRS